MKPCLALIAIVFYSSIVYAQPKSAVALDDPQFEKSISIRTIPRVTGKLNNITPDEIRKTKINATVVTLNGQIALPVEPAADGSFSFQLENPFPYQQVWLEIGDYFYTGLYLNKDLHIQLDISKIKASGTQLYFYGEGAKFLGTDGPLNIYMNEFINFRREEQLKLNDRINEIPHNGEPHAHEVIAAYRNVFDSLQLIQAEYIAKHPSPYAWVLEQEHLYEFYGKIFVRYWGNKMEDSLFNSISRQKMYMVTNSSTGYSRYMYTYFSMLPELRTINVGLKDMQAVPDLNPLEKAALDTLGIVTANGEIPEAQMPAYNRCMDLILPVMTKARQKKFTQSMFHKIDSTFFPASADLLKIQAGDNKDLYEQKLLLETVLPTIKTSWSAKHLQKTYDKTLSKIAAVNKALAGKGNSITAAGFGAPLQQTGFGASLYHVSNIGVEDFLTMLRKSFPDKAIVFDLWATWCSPCISEMPHSKKLQLESKDLPVVFVYVCTNSGSDENKWKIKLGELEMPGVHFFIDGKLDAEIRNHFSFSGYPGYAFIDRNGEYKPGAIKRVSLIKDRNELAKLVNQ